MTALTIAAADVALVRGSTAKDQVAGEAFDAGALVYRKSTDSRWYKAQCDGTADEAGAAELGMALATADAAGARISVAQPGAVVAVGTGTKGVVYCPAATAGSLAPVADLVTTNKVTVAALGIGNSQLLLAHVYHAAAVL